MRIPLLLAALPLAASLMAQCDHTPTITPTDLILCPLATGEVSTQVYDSYQWYRNDEPIPEATQQTLQVDYYFYAGSHLTVRTEVAGCFAMSAPVLVNGWVFLAPSVYTTGDTPLGWSTTGAATYCEGAYVQLDLGAPYTENITWYRDGEPIAGANTPTLVVETAGSYYVEGAPGLCPTLITSLGLSVDILFQAPTQPVITAQDGLLCASPAGPAYAWYVNEIPLPGSNSACIEPSEPGAYTVRVFYPDECHILSAPYLSTGIDGADAAPWSLHPTPDGGGIIVNGADPALAPGTTWRITDVQGRHLRHGTFATHQPLHVDLSDLPNGIYLFQAAQDLHGLASATRFVLMR